MSKFLSLLLFPFAWIEERMVRAVTLEVLRTPHHPNSTQRSYRSTKSSSAMDDDGPWAWSCRGTRAQHSAPWAPFTESYYWSPATNVDGSPMMGSLDINGNPWGVTDSSLHSHSPTSSMFD
ncbi:MAG: hypothetical protein KF892_09890 [Rhizobacter sp.]|nr:hypothetical protein [Rhizobacter sp.]